MLATYDTLYIFKLHVRKTEKQTETNKKNSVTAQINAMHFSRTQLPQLHVTVLHYVIQTDKYCLILILNDRSDI